MKRLYAIALSAMLLSAPLAACGTTGGFTLPNASGTLVDEKALMVAEAAYKGETILLEAAVDSGQLKGANAQMARTINAKAHESLLAARSLQGAAQTAKANDVLGLIGDVQVLLQKPKKE